LKIIDVDINVLLIWIWSAIKTRVRADVVVFSFPCVFNVCGQEYVEGNFILFQWVLFIVLIMT